MRLHRKLLPALLTALLLAATLAFGAGTVQLDSDRRHARLGDGLPGVGRTVGQSRHSQCPYPFRRGNRQGGHRNPRRPDHPTYLVTGIIRSRDELVTPGGRYRRADVGRLTQWLNDLAERGPISEKQAKAAFGLSATQFQKVCQDLATPVGISTEGRDRHELVQKIAQRLTLPLKFDAEATQAMGDEKVKADLSDLTCGTSLAYVLRSAGYGLVPRWEGARGTLRSGQGVARRRGLAGRNRAAATGVGKIARPIRVPQRQHPECVGCRRAPRHRQTAQDHGSDRPGRLNETWH